VLARQQQGHEQDRAELAHHADRHDQAAEWGFERSRVAHHRHEHAQRRGGQRDRDDDPRIEQAQRATRVGDREAERQAGDPAGECEPQRLAANGFELNFESGKEEQKRHADGRDRRHGAFRRGPAEALRADGHTQGEFEYDDRQADAPRELAEQRRDDRSREDDEERRNVQIHAGPLSNGPRRASAVECW
jgi:hypothetical protein